MVRKSNGSINVRSAIKVSEEVKITNQVLPDVPVSGNYFIKKKVILCTVSPLKMQIL